MVHQTFGFLAAPTQTHFDHAGEVARLEGARAVGAEAARLDRVHGVDLAVIACDLNDKDTSPAYAHLTTAAGFEDAYVSSLTPPHGPTASFTGFAHEHAARIDYLFLRESRQPSSVSAAVLSYTTEVTSYDDGSGTVAPSSDHRPVFATVSLAS